MRSGKYVSTFEINRTWIAYNFAFGLSLSINVSTAQTHAKIKIDS